MHYVPGELWLPARRTLVVGFSGSSIVQGTLDEYVPILPLAVIQKSVCEAERESEVVLDGIRSGVWKKFAGIFNSVFIAFLVEEVQRHAGG